MKKEVVILVADDDEGHAKLIQKNLARSGIANEMIHFKDGQETLDFLFQRGDGRTRLPGVPYLLLLDIRMPKVDGVEVLRQLKQDGQLRKLPVIMVTTTDNPVEVDRCHEIGCNNYISKPVDYDKFVDAIRQLGLFLAVVQVPHIDGKTEESSQ